MRVNNQHWLKNVPIAHRGLWGADIIENTLSAYQNAIDFGYAIEVDVFSSTDGVLFSFHDDNLTRLTGVDAKIYEKDSAFIKSLSLCNREKIPTFSDLLFTVNGKVPLLIEIKNQPDKKIVERVLDELYEYQGEYAIQSFNPFYINKVKKIAPHVIRGVLGTNLKESKSAIKNFIIKKMPFNKFIKPDFISYNHTGLPLNSKKTKDKALLAWTITSQSQLDKIKNLCDNVIFEKFIP